MVVDDAIMMMMMWLLVAAYRTPVLPTRDISSLLQYIHPHISPHLNTTHCTMVTLVLLQYIDLDGGKLAGGLYVVLYSYR